MSSNNYKQKLDSNVVFIHHSIRFPNLSYGNKGAQFGVDDSNISKDIVSFGKYGLIPISVWTDVFGDWKVTPIYKLGTVRSQLQAFVDKYTWSYLAGAARAMPLSMVEAFVEITDVLRNRFLEAKQDYLDHLNELHDKSIIYWEEEWVNIFQTPAGEGLEIIDKVLSNTERISKSFNFTAVAMQLTNLDTGNLKSVGRAAANQLVADSDSAINISAKKLMEDSVKDLRQRILSAYSGLLDKVRSGKFNQKSVNALKRVLSDFDKMNMMDDKRLSAFVENARTELDNIKVKDIKKGGNGAMFATFTEYVENQTDILEGIKQDGVNDVVSAFIGQAVKSVDVDETEEVVEESGVIDEFNFDGDEDPF